MHWMLNFVTEETGSPAAVLLRAILPEEGEARMHRRRAAWRKGRSVSAALKPAQLTDGPAKLAQALKLNGDWNGRDLCAPGSRIFVEKELGVKRVTTGPRVGLNSVPEPWKSVAWRFRVPRDDYRLLRGREEFR
jgi:DNA-3-methyladenine glycosylase